MPDTVLIGLKRDVIAAMADQFSTPKNQVGFADCRVHSFRHFFVSQAFLGGASEGEIREWVGYTESRIIERYRHLVDQDARRKMDRIDFIGGDSDNAGVGGGGDGNHAGGEGGVDDAGVGDGRDGDDDGHACNDRGNRRVGAKHTGKRGRRDGRKTSDAA